MLIILAIYFPLLATNISDNYSGMPKQTRQTECQIKTPFFAVASTN